MMIKMLQAASEMLVFTTQDEFRVRVDCAKIILDKVIESCKEKEHPELSSVSLQIPEARFKEKEELPYKVVVDAKKTLVKIEGLPLDEMIEVDGIRMTHQDAIGKHFENAKIL